MYQLIVPVEEVAPIETVPSPHLLPVLDEVIVGIVFMVEVTAVRELDTHPFEMAPTKYDRVELIDGVVKFVPEPSEAPPVASANQFKFPEEASADRETVPLPQRVPGVVDIIVGKAFTVASTELLDTLTQPLLVASTK